MRDEGLEYTLDVCEQSLPGGTHPIHWERLREIRRIVRRDGAMETRNAALVELLEDIAHALYADDIKKAKEIARKHVIK